MHVFSNTFVSEVKSEKPDGNKLAVLVTNISQYGLKKVGLEVGCTDGSVEGCTDGWLEGCVVGWDDG